MKLLLLARHAKSSWKFPHLDDHDRPLNKRGVRDALAMAQHIAGRVPELDLIISSSAARAAAFAHQIQLTCSAPLSENRALYTFDNRILLSEVREVSDDIDSLLVVGHNPAVTDLCNQLGAQTIANVPTAGLVCLNVQSPSWRDISPAVCRFQWFETPKMLR